MTPKSTGIQKVTYVINMYDMVIVEFVDCEKVNEQRNKQTNKQQTNQRRRKDYSCHATITNMDPHAYSCREQAQGDVGRGIKQGKSAWEKKALDYGKELN